MQLQKNYSQLFGEYWQSSERARELHAHLRKIAEQIEQKRVRKESAAAGSPSPSPSSSGPPADASPSLTATATGAARTPKWSIGALAATASAIDNNQSRSMSLSASSSSSSSLNLSVSAIELSLPSELSEALDSPLPPQQQPQSPPPAPASSTEERADRSARSSAERSSDDIDSPAPRTYPPPPSEVKLSDAASNRFLSGLFGSNLERKLNAAIKHYHKVWLSNAVICYIRIEYSTCI